MNFPSTSSGLKTADTQILASEGRLRNLVVLTDGTNDATVVLYDTETGTATGNVLAKLIVPGAAFRGDISWESNGVNVMRGIWADVTGTGAAYLVYFNKG